MRWQAQLVGVALVAACFMAALWFLPTPRPIVPGQEDDCPPTDAATGTLRCWSGGELGAAGKDEAMTEPKFERGDLVRHRASGEAAVVMQVARGVTASDELGGPGFIGFYDLSLGFERRSARAAEWELEAVEAERGDAP